MAEIRKFLDPTGLSLLWTKVTDELDKKADETSLPTKVSDLQNDAGYLTQETDPTVPSWAKTQTKPSYTAQEVGALPENTFIPSNVSDLTNDTGFITSAALPTNVSDLTNDAGYLTEHQDISGKVNAADLAAVATSGSYNDLSNKPFIPSAVSDLTDDSGHYTKPVGGIPATDLAETYLTEHQDISGKVDKVTGKGLSTNDFTDAYKTKLDNALTEHQDISGKANSADLATVATSGSYNDLLNKPTIPTAVSQLTDDSGHYTKPVTGIPASDLEEAYLTSFTETDPTVPSWAKQTQKPTYTAQEIGALPDNTFIPSKVSDLQNDSGYLTQHQDLSNYVQKTDYATKDGNYGLVKININKGLTIAAIDGTLITNTAGSSEIKAGDNMYKPIVPGTSHQAAFYGLAKAAGDSTQSSSNNTVGTYTDGAKTAIQTMLDVPSNATVTSAIATAIGNIHQFSIQVVQSLPTQDIQEHTVYFVPKTGETNDVYDEYIYVNNGWEMIGNTQIDLSNYATKSEIPEVPVQDVQVNGTSILSQGVAEIPIMTNSVKGIAYAPGTYGIRVSNGALLTNYAITAMIKDGTSAYRPIVPYNQHEAAFYGLAKAAGDTTQSQSDNAVGTYTTEAKAAIQQMLNIPSINDIPVELGTGIGSVKTKDFIINGTTYSNIASNVASFSEGIRTSATGAAAHAEGQGTLASATSSHAEGIGTKATGQASHAEGWQTIASQWNQHVQGQWNISDENGLYADIIGNGTNENTRSNAYTLDWEGNGHYMGNIYVGANADSTGGTRLATITEVATKLDAAEAGLKVVRLI